MILSRLLFMSILMSMVISVASFAQTCGQELSEFDRTVRAEFATKFNKLLKKELSTGKLSQDDLLKGEFGKAVTTSNSRAVYVLKGTKNLFVFVEKKNLGIPHRYVKSFAPSTVPGPGGYPRYALTTARWRNFPSLNLGKMGTLRITARDNDHREPWVYEIAPATLISDSPDDIIKRFTGAPQEEDE